MSVSDRAFLIDAVAVVAVSLLICTVSDRLALMTIAVPAIIAVRLLLWWSLRELPFFALCTVLGGANDWLSVMHYDIYDYTVPHYFAASDIPVWMLLFWGMVLRFLATLFEWRSSSPGESRDAIHIRSRPWHNATAKIAIELALVIATRQMIYRWYGDPVLSWLPLAVALIVYAVLFRPDRRERILIAVMVVGGPLVEVLYIQLGGLHRYDLGWLSGVPVWIALWWVLAALVWKDISGRILARLR